MLLNRRRHCLLVLAIVMGTAGGIVAPAQADNPATTATPRSGPKDKWWMDRHEAFLKRAKEGNINVLFLGDSITEGWHGAGRSVWESRYAPLGTANFGIGGDQTQHVLWRITQGQELKGVHPKAIVLMIGTNNIGAGQEPAQVAEGITAIVRTLREKRPNAQILLLAVFPRDPEATSVKRQQINEVNEQIAKLDDGQHVHYLDIGSKFLTPDGKLTKEIMPDFLHLSPKGYQIWANAIQPSLDRMLKRGERAAQAGG